MATPSESAADGRRNDDLVHPPEADADVCHNAVAADTYDCPDCGEPLADEIGTQVCECGFTCVTYEGAAPGGTVDLEEFYV